VHKSFERLPPPGVQWNAQTLKNVHERAFAETEDAGKWLKIQCHMGVSHMVKHRRFLPSYYYAKN
jgi:hypothetical protein